MLTEDNYSPTCPTMGQTTVGTTVIAVNRGLLLQGFKSNTWNY